jgi:hypothetical protein
VAAVASTARLVAPASSLALPLLVLAEHLAAALLGRAACAGCGAENLLVLLLLAASRCCILAVWMTFVG